MQKNIDKSIIFLDKFVAVPTWSWLGLQPHDALVAVNSSATQVQIDKKIPRLITYRISDLSVDNSGLATINLQLVLAPLASVCLLLDFGALDKLEKIKSVFCCLKSELPAHAQLRVGICVHAGSRQNVSIIGQWRLQRDSQLELAGMYTGDGKVSDRQFVFLAAPRAHASVQTFYESGGGQIDNDYQIVHASSQTRSQINTDGIIRTNGQKTWRATIDFRAGSRGSQGSESENVLVLGQAGSNKSLPIILTHEDDIKATHSVSSGRVSDEVECYASGRGLTREQIEQLLIDGKKQKVQGLIDQWSQTKG